MHEIRISRLYTRVVLKVIRFNRPYIDELHSKILKRVLIDIYDRWFLENNIWYNLKRGYHNPYKIYLVFRNKEDAILFKLTWIGI